MSDRRRINGPPGGTTVPAFFNAVVQRPQRKRKPHELRKIFLQTGHVPAAAGSAYLELESLGPAARSLTSTNSTIKVSCTVHGPKPLPRNAVFSPNLQLTASVRFAPFATSVRRGYVRDSAERDLGAHLENALKGVIIPDRWPKSALDVAITVLEAEGEKAGAVNENDSKCLSTLAMMNVLASCITVASAALVNAKIDCLDLMTGGVTASVEGVEMLDPAPAEHETVEAATVVGYLPSRDEVTELWTVTDGLDSNAIDSVLDGAIDAAKTVQKLLKDVMIEATTREANTLPIQEKGKAATNDESNDVDMKT